MARMKLMHWVGFAALLACMAGVVYANYLSSREHERNRVCCEKKDPCK